MMIDWGAVAENTVLVGLVWLFWRRITAIWHDTSVLEAQITHLSEELERLKGKIVPGPLV